MLQQIQKTLAKLPARNVATILQELERIRLELAKTNEALMPLITIYLKSGQHLTGWLLLLAEDSLMLHVYDADSRAVSSEVLYLDLIQLEAVSIHNTQTIAHLLTKDWQGLPATASVPTRLEVRQQAQTFSEQLENQAGLTLTYEVEPMPEGELLYWVIRAMQKVTSILLEITKNEVGRGVIQELVESVQFVPASQNSVRLEAKTLVINLVLGSEQASFELQTAIEDAL